MKDLYDILGVNNNASKDGIKKAYRKIAMKFHPDKNPNDKKAELIFKDSAEAYAVLKDQKKRAQYDQFGHAGVGLGDAPRGSSASYGHMSMDDIFSNFGDMFGGSDPFESIFGGGSRKQVLKGVDLRVTLNLEYIDILKGTEKTIKIKRHDTCDPCNGSGARAGTGVSTCLQCSGSGQIRQMSQTFFGQQVIVRDCPICEGSGKMIEHPCNYCGGNGLVRKTAEIKVKVPVGVASGNYMTLKGQGNKGPKNHASGDLIVFFQEKEHPIFTRHGNDVFTEAHISFYKAVLGTTLEVPTIEGKAKMKIPSGIQSGQILRMRGKGFPRLRGSSRGDQMVRIHIKTPKTLSKQERILLGELATLNGHSESEFKRMDLD